MDFTSNGKMDKIVKTGTAAGVGFLAWQSAATNKYPYDPSVGIISQHRFIDALSGITGSNLANQASKAVFGPNAYQMTPTSGVTNLNGPKFTPFGALNSITFSGVGILIANSLLKEWVGQYKRFPIVPEVVEGAGWGALIGGVIGGMFDPVPSSQAPVSPLLQGNYQASTQRGIVQVKGGLFA